MNNQTSKSFPASPSEAKGALLALFEAFPADRGEGSLAVGTYLIAIEGYSLKAIEGAVKRIIRGEVDDIDKRFLPSPAQLGNTVAYLEKLYSPPERRLALPAPGDAEPTEEEWVRRKAQADAARERFGIKTTTGETVVDREAMPEALKAERDRAVTQAKDKLSGRMRLSPEAMQIFDRIPQLSDAEYEKYVGEREETLKKAVPSPDEAFDNWNREAAE